MFNFLEKYITRNIQKKEENKMNRVTKSLIVGVLFLTSLVFAQAGTPGGSQPAQQDPMMDVGPQSHRIKGVVLAWTYIEDDNGDYYALELDTNNDGVRDKYIVINPASVDVEEDAFLDNAAAHGDWVIVTIKWNPNVLMNDLEGVE
jgi:hypothetical protein